MIVITRRLSAALAAVVALLSACTTETDVSALVPTATVRDSAGVTIVENAPLAEIGALPWTLSPAPTLQLGDFDGDEAHQLFQVQDALRLQDGRIVVVDGGSQEIRVFTAIGDHVVSWGGEGDGPGEFRFISSVNVFPGDSLIAFDSRSSRLSIFAEDGALGRTLTLQGRDGMNRVESVSVLPGGSVVASGGSLEGVELRTGMVRAGITTVRVDAVGETVASFGRHAGGEVFFITLSEGGFQVVGPPFGLSRQSTTWTGSLVIAATDIYSLPTFDSTGRLRRIVRVLGDVPAVSQADIDTEIDYLVEHAPEERRTRLRANLEKVPIPATFPAFALAMEDAEGNLWVQDFRKQSQPGPERWTIFDPEGQALGRLETPEGLVIFQIGSDFILGRDTDELDVESVVLWDLRRTPS